jgi:hypothetical protein
MTALARAAVSVIALASAGLIAACGSAAPTTGGSPAIWAPPVGAGLLDTSTDTAAGTWATVVMGGSVASHDNFWQLFIRPAGSQRWKLVTPPGVADNGGLVLAAAGPALITGFRPSQGLTFTPLTATRDGGTVWSSTGPLDASLANVPDALAAAPGSGNLLALQADGTASIAAPGYTRWATLTSPRSLAATPAGQRCGLHSITAVAYTPAGQPLLGGTCSRPGTTGIFTDTGGSWQTAGPALPAELASEPVTVLRLTVTNGQIVALLTAGSGQAARLLAAWSADNAQHWTVSSPLPLNGAAVASAAFGPEGTAAVITTGGTAAVITSTGSWQRLPVLPAGTATLAAGLAGQTDALAVHRGTLTVWQLAVDGSIWTKTQVIGVPIQYGSSS